MAYYNGTYGFRPGYHGPRKPGWDQAAITGRICACGQFLVPHREGDDPRVIWPAKCPSCEKAVTK